MSELDPATEAPEVSERRSGQQLMLEPRATSPGEATAPADPEHDTSPGMHHDPQSGALENEDENRRLEELLRERAREAHELRARAREAEGVVRDLMAQMQSASRSEPPSDHSMLRERAIEAEVARAETQLRLDEVLGHFTALRSREEQHQADLSERAAAEAALVGRERGLRAALAEAEETRDIALARATLLQHDLMLSSEDRNELARELAEAHENLELHMAQARALSDRFEHGFDSNAADALRGQLSGVSLRLAEQERAAHVLAELLSAARNDGQEQRRSLGALRAELSARQVDHREAASRVGLIERELERERDRSRELAAESVRKAAEVVALRAELEQAQANLAVVQGALGEGQSEATAVNAELTKARVRFATEQQRALGLRDALRDARDGLRSAGRELQALHRDVSQGPQDPTEPGMPLFEPDDSAD